MRSLETLIPTLLLAAAITCSKALDFGEWPRDDGVMYACVGNSVTFSWKYEQEDDEELVDVHWEFGSAFSMDIIASFTREQFLPNPLYSNRLSHVPNAGMTLNDVTLEDTGNYSVEVNGYDSARTFFSHRRTVFLQVADDVMIKGHSLHIRQDPIALWNPEREEWAIRLLCGTFTFRGHPPVGVTWTSPTGDETSSTSFDSGTFSLTLPSPVTGGNYSCHLPNHLLPEVCAKRRPRHDDDETLVKAKLFVDELKARMSVMEAEQKDLKGKHRKLLKDNALLSGQLQSVEDFHEEMVANLSTQLRQDLQQGLAPLKKGLVSDKRPAVAFHARLSASVTYDASNDLSLTDVITNLGEGYDAKSGVFTAPLSGVYFVTGVASVGGSDNRAYLKLIVEDDEVAYSHAFQESHHYQTGSCNAVLQLEKGQRVWLKSDGKGFFWGKRTSFSGFLIAADP